MAFSLKVNRAELADALTALATVNLHRQAADAILHLADGMLQITLPGCGVRAAAAGEWTGEVRVPGSLLVALARALPPDDPLPVVVDQGRLLFAKFSAPCIVQPRSGNHIELALGTSLADLLRMRHRHAREEIERSGLTKVIRQAENHRDKLIERAHRFLSQLDVGLPALRRLVEECVRGKTDENGIPPKAPRNHRSDGDGQRGLDAKEPHKSYGLKIARDELHDALMPVLRAFKTGQLGSVVLSFANGELSVDFGGACARIAVAAEGEWPGPVKISYPGQFVRAIKHLQKVPFLNISAEGTRISIGDSVVQCTRIK